MLLNILAVFDVTELNQVFIQNIIQRNEVPNMELFTLIISIIQLLVDIAAYVGSSPTIRYHLTNMAQSVEHMAEYLKLKSCKEILIFNVAN